MKILTMLGACCSLLAATFMSPASADELTISPLSIHVRPNSPVGSVTLENRGTEPVRVQVSGFAWSESGAGEMQLSPADQLIFFPTLLTVEPGQRRQVKVGFDHLTPAALERTFRVFFLELPPLDLQLSPLANSGPTIKYRTKFGVPLFVDAASPQPQPRIDGGDYAGGTYSFHLINDGNAHVLATRVTATAHDANGNVLMLSQFKGWYLLAKQDRTYDVALDPKLCARVHDVAISVELDGAKDPLVHTFAAPPACR